MEVQRFDQRRYEMKKPSLKYRVQCKLEKEGFAVAPVADSTFPVDLLAIRDGKTRGYRVKAHGKIYKEELKKIREFAHEFRIAVFITKVNSANEITMFNAEAYS
jgi:Holliday junction resolvase